MEKFFEFKRRHATVRAEIIAGVTTFMAMAYILAVNPGMFSDLQELHGVTFGAVYIATALSAVIGTALIGLLANLPLAQASGMGLNAFFVYTVCFNLGFTYANALVFVLFDGILFVILSATGLRRVIFDAIPSGVKKAIPAGIGLFIAFLGVQDAGIVVADSATGVTLASFNIFGGNATWGSVMPMLITIVAVVVIGVLSKKGVKGAILWSILGATVAYYLLGFTVPGFYAGFSEKISFNPLTAFGEFGALSFGKVFTEGFNFDFYLAGEGHNAVSLGVSFATTALAFCMVDMFDTLGTLYGACRGGDLLVLNPHTGEDEVPNMDKAMLADAIATCAGAVCGTSTVTTYVESSAGVAAGGRTGLSSLVTAGLFLISMFFSPIAALIPSCAYAAALIYVGKLMIGSLQDINWTDPTTIAFFLAFAMMPFTYNISYGIAFGLIAFVLSRLFDNEVEEISIPTWIITILFVVMLFTTH